MGETEREQIGYCLLLLLHIAVCLWNRAEPNCVLSCYLQRAAHCFRANTWLHYSTLVTQSHSAVLVMLSMLSRRDLTRKNANDYRNRLWVEYHVVVSAVNM